jgi:hypothetical protein
MKVSHSFAFHHLRARRHSHPLSYRGSLLMRLGLVVCRDDLLRRHAAGGLCEYINKRLAENFIAVV